MDIETYLYSLNEAFKLNVATPEDLLKWMDVIKYGWMDKSGKRHHNFEGFWDNYVLLLPHEVYKHKIGTCFEQTIFENYIFDKYFNFEHKMIFVQQYYSSVHTALAYKENGKWMYFEHAYDKFRKIWGPFSHISYVMNDIYKKMDILRPMGKGYKGVIMDPKKFTKKLTAKEFFDACQYDYDKSQSEEIAARIQGMISGPISFSFRR